MVPNKNHPLYKDNKHMKFLKSDLMEVLKQLIQEEKTAWTLLWTSNSTITSGGRSVMGRGLAKKLATTYPVLKDKEARALTKLPREEDKIDIFNKTVKIFKPQLHLVHKGNRGNIAAFPVKRGYWEKADIEIIEFNAILLSKIAKKNPHHTYHINYPGIGAGKLAIEEVYPILKKWWTGIDNIIVYTFPSKGETAVTIEDFVEESHK